MISTGRRAQPVARVAKLGSEQHGDERPALRLTRYFCNRGLEKPTSAMRQLLLVVPSQKRRGRICRRLLGHKSRRAADDAAVVQTVMTAVDQRCGSAWRTSTVRASSRAQYGKSFI